MHRESVWFMQTQASNLRDARIESLEERKGTAREMEKVRDDHKQLLKHQRENFDRVRNEEALRWVSANSFSSGAHD